jgi:hypothetical protein
LLVKCNANNNPSAIYDLLKIFFDPFKMTTLSPPDEACRPLVSVSFHSAFDSAANEPELRASGSPLSRHRKCDALQGDRRM